MGQVLNYGASGSNPNAPLAEVSPNTPIHTGGQRHSGCISVVFLRRSATRGDRRSPHGIFAQESLRFLRIEARLLALALSVHLRQYKPNFLSNGGATGRKRW